MASIIDDLLLPISLEHPLGANLRANNHFDNPYYQLKNLRHQARLAERQRMERNESEILNATEWQPVAVLATRLLKEQSIDLEIASVLVEAWTRIDGFKGLANGLDLLDQLIEKFSDFILAAETEEKEIQLAMVKSLCGEQQSGTLILPLMSLPILLCNGKNFATWQYQQLLELKDSAAKKNFEEMQRDAKSTSADFSQTLTENIIHALAAVDRCEITFTNVFHEQAPQWHLIRKTLENIESVVKNLYVTSPIQTNSTIEKEDNHATLTTTQFNERHHALSAINQAAEFFLQHEPHSPVAYLLKQAVRWADLPLPHLMQEIFSNSQSYYEYCRLTGIGLISNSMKGEENNLINEEENDEDLDN